MNVELSTVSKSATEATVNFKEKLNGKNSKIDVLFPMCDQTNTYVRYPELITYMVAVYFFLQASVSGLWPVVSFYDGKDTTIIGLITNIFWFIDASNPKGHMLTTLIVLVSITAFCIFWISFELIYYHFKRSYMRWSLYIFKLCLDTLAPLTVHPIAALITYSFKALVEDGGVYWVYFIVGIICYIIAIVIVAFAISINSRAIILTRSPFPSDNVSVLIGFTVTNSGIMIVMSIFNVFSDWTEIIVQVLHMVIFIYLAVKIWYFPFIKMFHNAFTASITITSLLMDVLFICLFFTDGVSVYVPLMVLVVLLVIGCISFYFIFNASGKSIHKSMCYGGNNMTQEEKDEFFTSLKLNTNDDRASKYLIVGMINMSDMFVDLSLIDYLIKENPSSRIICSLAQKIAFFPSEVRKLNSLFRTMLKKRDIGFSERFMLYQINRIKTLRASSVSLESNELIYELHNLNNQSEADIRSFWSMQHPTVSFCEKIGKAQNNNLLIWKEALETYPNNAKISYEYSRFLTETITNFDAAIVQQQRASLIEAGRNFAIDNSFRSFVRTYPSYLLNEILDEHGTRIMKKKMMKESTTSKSHSSNSNNFSTSGTGISIDAELEDQISKKIIKFSKMRMALHRSIDDRKLHIRVCFWAEALLSFVAVTAFFVFFYVYVSSEYEVRRTVIERLYDCAKLRYIEDVAIFVIWCSWARETGRLTDNTVIGTKEHLEEIDKDFQSYVDLSGQYEKQVMNYVDQARSSLNHLITSLTDLAAGGADVYTLSSTMLQATGKIAFCNNHERVGSYESTFKDKFIYMLYLNGKIAGDDDKSDIFKTNDFCEVYVNSLDFIDDATNMFMSFNDDSNQKGDELNTILMIITYIAPPGLALIIFVPSLVLIILAIRNIQHLLDIISGLSPEAKEAAKAPIRTDIDAGDKTTSEVEAGMTSSVFYGVIYSVLAVIIAILCYFYINEAVDANNLTTNYNQWFYKAVLRTCTSGEVVLEVANVIVFNDSVSVPYTNRSHNLKLVIQDTNMIVEANNVLLRGDDEMGAFYGYDDYLDNLHFKERCTLSEPAKSPHDLYACASVIQQIAVFRDLIDEIRTRPDDYGGAVDDIVTHNFIHLVTDHLWDAFSIVDERLVTLVNEIYTNLLSTSRKYLVGGIIVVLLICAFTYFYVTILDLSYSCAISLIKHIPPVHIIASKELMNFLLNKKANEEDKSMSISQSIIHNSADAIICTGPNLVIEIANPAVSSTLGYTPDQLLGQPVASFFVTDDAEKVTKQVELMMNGQSATTYEDHFTCITDSSAEVHFHTTLVGMKNEGSNEISSFVFILTDETDLLKKQEEAEKAKQKSESLLYQILPKDIVVRLNRGEKDISFSIPHASIIFIDIVKFSDYTASLTPQEIMGNLSQIFAAFDSDLAKYEKMTKIKLIGDDYMAAGGLFGKPEEPASGHAEEIIKFAIDCLADLEEINVKLNASLEVRIGINTGGPLYAGVLGTDKPVFDIIGDPINIAARLQSTDIPGKIQISAATKELVDGLFSIEERGEVFLKGKGKQKTYLVSPAIIGVPSNPSFNIGTMQ